MKWDKLKTNIGFKVQLVPTTCHLDAGGDILPARGEDWTITATGADFLEINSGLGYQYRLGKDHVHHYTSDAHRSLPGEHYGFLTLNVQLFVQSTTVRAVPNSRPGLPVDPPVADKATRARVHFILEIERRFRRQVQVLDRCLLNFGLTSNDKPSNPPDTWASLRPARTTLYPNAAPLGDVSATDATLLAEFHGAVDEVEELLDNWISSGTQPEYNCWNYLMHKVEHGLRMGSNVIRKFCADRQFDTTSPASGTLLSRAETGLGRANQMRTAFIERKQAEHALAAARRAHPGLSSRMPRSTIHQLQGRPQQPLGGNR
jgi:hypothetical protein